MVTIQIFQVPLQIRLAFSPKENTQWIKTVKLAKKIHKQQEKEFYKSFYPITRYFQAIQNRRNAVINHQQNNSLKKSILEITPKKDSNKLR